MEKSNQLTDNVIHRLKLLCVFANDVLYGDKSFELRYNDRNYQKDDFIKFSVVDDKGNILNHPLNHKLFKIIYMFLIVGD